jgi:hypothetical protein
MIPLRARYGRAGDRRDAKRRRVPRDTPPATLLPSSYRREKVMLCDVPSSRVTVASYVPDLLWRVSQLNA